MFRYYWNYQILSSTMIRRASLRGMVKDEPIEPEVWIEKTERWTGDTSAAPLDKVFN